MTQSTRQTSGWQQSVWVTADPLPTPSPPCQSDWNVVVHAQRTIAGSVNYGRGAASKKSRRDHRPCAPAWRTGRKERGGSRNAVGPQ